MNALDHVLDRLIGRLEHGRALGGSPPAVSRTALRDLVESGPAPAPAATRKTAPQLVSERLKETVTKHLVAPAPVPVQAAPVRVELRDDDPRPRAERLAELREQVAGCLQCPSLAQFRTQTVFGVGNLEAELMFVGEAPGADEDRMGEPFVGLAGQLLSKIIKAMGMSREEVYIANVLKCRPDIPRGSTGNRRPTPAEMATCLPYLRAQIQIIRPKIIVAMGAVAMEGLFGVKTAVGSLRGRWHEWGGIPVMPTFHPAYLLHNQSMVEKRKVWDDMLVVLARLEKPINETQRQFFRAKYPPPHS